MVTNKIRIGGMSCVNCQNTIERKLKGTGGVESAVVDFGGGTAIITYNEAVISRQEIGSIIEALGYQILEAPQKQGAVKLAQTGGLIVIIIALYMLMRQFSLSSFATAFPLAEAGMNYGMLLVIGLITSVHCVAMCGGINLSQTLGGGSSPGTGPRDFRVLLPSLLYNTGRVVSYTVIGAIVGALGSVLTVSGRFQGIIQLAAGVFMV
ncbi:MAG: sulfite exporter TauE/SafE family protein, partial [Treponema sp.]|nr:sulfite exporter TauE/SafE family protein [Treponema sp.]